MPHPSRENLDVITRAKKGHRATRERLTRLERNRLMGELLEDHIRNHMPRNSKPSEEAAADLTESVRTYLK
jgi:hypothetical protein